MSPARTAPRIGPPSASKRVAPSASRASMAARSRVTARPSPFSPTLTALITEPSTMPTSGTSTRGSYQSAGRRWVR